MAQLKTDQFAAYDDVWKSIGNKAYTDDYADLKSSALLGKLSGFV